MKFKSKASSSSGKDEKTTKEQKGSLNEVFDESVVERVLEDMKANTPFVLTENDTTKYIGALFEAEQIGGLSGKQAKRDESKGSIIEAIRVGHIKTYIKTEMLSDNCFIIIPDKDSVESMDEFNMLAQAKYKLCVIDPLTAEVEVIEDKDGNEVSITFPQLRSVSTNQLPIKALFPSDDLTAQIFNESNDFIEEAEETVTHEGDDILSGSDESEPKSDKNDNADDLEDIDDIEDLDSIGVDESPEDFDEFNSHMNSADDSQLAEDATEQFAGAEPIPEAMPAPEPISVQEPAPEPKPAPVEEPVRPAPAPVQAQPSESTFTQKYASEAYEDTGTGVVSDIDDGYGYDDENYEEEEYEDIPASYVDNYTKTTFYSDDLGLEIVTDPFDAHFAHGNAFIPFDEHRGPGWLNEQVSNIAKDANTRMSRLHADNLAQLRSRYMKIMYEHCRDIADNLSVTDPEKPYGNIVSLLEATRVERLNQIDDTIRPRVDKLEDTWNSTLERIGEAAKADAIRQHIERYGDAHNQDIETLRRYEKDEIERDHSNSIARINAERRSEATKLLDIAINTTLKDLSETYIKMLESEKKEYIRIQNEITKFIDDNRKHEIARIDALSEENRLNEEADKVRKEYISKIRAMAAEFDTKISSMQADVNKMRLDHANEVTIMKRNHTDLLAEEKKRSAALQQQVDELVAKFADLDNQKNSEYGGQILRLKGENESYKEEIDHVINVQKKSSKMYLYLVIAAVIAAIGVGFILGSILNVRRESDYETRSQQTTTSTVSTESTNNADVSDDA